MIEEKGIAKRRKRKELGVRVREKRRVRGLTQG